MKPFELVGAFLVAEAVTSLVASQDQRLISNIGRGLRIIAGIWVIRQGTYYSQLAHRDRKRLR